MNNVGEGTDAVLVTPDLAVLWRLAGRQLPDGAPPEGEPTFRSMRPRVLYLMLELLMNELEQEPPEVPPSAADLTVLLSSTNARVRMLGIRLSTFRQT